MSDWEGPLRLLVLFIFSFAWRGWSIKRWDHHGANKQIAGALKLDELPTCLSSTKFACHRNQPDLSDSFKGWPFAKITTMHSHFLCIATNILLSVVEIVLRLIFQASLEEQASMYREIMMISRDIMEQQVLVVMNTITFFGCLWKKLCRAFTEPSDQNVILTTRVSFTSILRRGFEAWLKSWMGKTSNFRCREWS